MELPYFNDFGSEKATPGSVSSGCSAYPNSTITIIVLSFELEAELDKEWSPEASLALDRRLWHHEVEFGIREAQK
ncbi:hypothetical protein H6F88_18040 [Oculatella sp. FACHB-28]|uniref:hypothetical protein n=1 Tax=Oculatella sp. FACHB-28 TaxID=2692845 RepID=UPI00198E76E7|nr:hypothetical protein [Oculatella sp. FACHB-28]MBD2057897.1 hypothetical protein [Oculatella sp. FACHB-28]